MLPGPLRWRLELRGDVYVQRLFAAVCEHGGMRGCLVYGRDLLHEELDSACAAEFGRLGGAGREDIGGEQQCVKGGEHDFEC